MTTTTSNINAIIITRWNRIRNEFTGLSKPACITVVTVDDDDDEVDCRKFGADEAAKARDYAVKASDKRGVRLCGLADFDAGIWH